MTVRIGIIGTGFGARVMAPVLNETPGCEVVEVVSARDDAGVAGLCDRPDLDLVSIHSPPFLHTAHVRRAMRAGHAVLCDKPFGLNAAESETLLAAAEAADVLHLLNFEFRYHPMRERLRSFVAGGAIGKPEHVTWTHHSSGSRVPLRSHGWLFERAKGGGWIGAWGSHTVDTLRWILGEIVDARGARRTTIVARPDRDGAPQLCDAEDGFSAWLTFESFASAVIDSTFAATASLAPRITLSGSDGVIECVGDARITVRRGAELEEHERPTAGDGDPHLEPLRRWATVVRDAVEEGTAPLGAPTFADGLACARVLDLLRS